MRFRIRRLAERFRIPVAIVLAAHGAIHLMGFALLFTIVRPSGLTYADMRPSPGTAAGEAVGVAWLAAALLFIAGAFLLATRRHGWDRVTLAAVVVSLPVLAAVAGTAAAGVAVDGAVAAALLIDRIPAPVFRRHP
jgi:hypothetical protein